MSNRYRMVIDDYIRCEVEIIMFVIFFKLTGLIEAFNFNIIVFGCITYKDVADRLSSH